MSPKQIARTTGAFYLLMIVTAIIAQGFIAERLVDPANASVTAANISANADLYRFGYTMYMIEMVSQIIMTMLFYQLLKPVSRAWALIGAVIEVTGCGIKAFSRLFFVAPALVIAAPQYLSTFSAEQLQSLAVLFYKLNEAGAAIAVVFFGFNSVISGLLIVRSTYLPRVLGWIGVVGGLGWLTFLWPPLGYSINMYVAAFALLGSLAMIMYLLVRGVDEARWPQRA